MKSILNYIYLNNIEKVKEKKLVIENCISNAVALDKVDIKRYEIILTDGTKKDIVLKHKNNKILIKGIKLLSNNDLFIMIGLIYNHKIFGYNRSYEREINIYENIDSKLRKYFITYYGNYKRHGNYYLALDYINIRGNNDYKKIFNSLIEIQIFYYNHEECVQMLSLNNYSSNDYKRSKKILKRIFQKLDNNLFINGRAENIKRFINNIDIYHKKYSYHRTLSHNDFSLRNIFINENEIYFYDWELATYQNPEHDLIEFLIYNLDKYNDNEVKEIISYYKYTLLDKLDINIEDKEYEDIIRFNIYEFIVNRLSMLRLASVKLKLDNIDVLIKNTNRLIDIVGDVKYE